MTHLREKPNGVDERQGRYPIRIPQATMTLILGQDVETLAMMVSRAHPRQDFAPYPPARARAAIPATTAT